MTRLKRLQLVLLCGLICCSVVQTAEARPLYKKVLDRLAEDLLGKNKTDCSICHPGTKKSELNKIGQALDAELGEKNCRDEQKIEDALRKILKSKK